MFKTKVSLKQLLIYLFIVSLIYQSGSVRAALLREGVLFQLTRVLMLVVPICLLCRYRIKKNVILYIGICLLIGIWVVLINYFLYPDGILHLAYKIVIFLLSGVLYIDFKSKGISINDYIYRVLVALAIITLLFYFLAEIIKFPMSYFVVYSGNSYRYYNYYEIFFTYYYNQVLPRLSGLFWEPGVYQIYLNWALFLYIFEEKENKRELLVLLSSIILTKSTSGYCIAAVLMVVYINKSRFFSKKNRMLLTIVGITFASIISAVVVYKKVQTTGNDIYGSAFLRFSDISNGLSIFFKYPFTGVGFGNETEFMELDIHGRGISNGLISYAYMTGIIGLVIALYPFFRNIRISSYKLRQWIWTIMILIFNSTEPIYNLPVMAYILAVEYVTAFKKTRIEKGKIENGL